MNKSGPASTNAPKWEDARAKQKPRWDKLGQFLNRRFKHAADLGHPKYKLLQDGLVDAIRTGIVNADRNDLPHSSCLDEAVLRIEGKIGMSK